jgi:hypothetical protein
MGNFSKEIPLNPDSCLGPVTIGSKIIVERGREPLPLEGGNVEVVPGCGWDKKTVSISQQMNATSTKLNIRVSLPGGIPLTHYTGVILKRKPIKLKVTLFPRMAMPGMGVPVNVPAAPITDEVDVTIPVVPQPELVVEKEAAKRTAGGNFSFAVKATVKNIPGNVSQDDQAALAGAISLDLKDQVNIVCNPGTASVENYWKRMEIEALTDSRKQMESATVTVDVSVRKSGIDLEQSCLFSIPVEKNYALNLDRQAVQVTPEQSGTFSAWVTDRAPDGGDILVPDAALFVDLPSGSPEFLLVSPGSATGTLACTVSQKKDAPVKEVILTVGANVGDDSIPPGKGNTVTVSLRKEIPAGALEVGFEPEGKDNINPFIGKDSVTLKARLHPEKGPAPGSGPQPSFEFRPEREGGWLDPPYQAKTCPAGWACMTFEARDPEPDSVKDPPASENVVVTATLDGRFAGTKTVPVALLSRPLISADKTSFNLLANAGSKKGKGEARTREDVTLTVENPAGRTWQVEAKAEKDEPELITIERKTEGASSAVYRFAVKDPLPVPGDRIGQYAYQQTVRVKTTASSGDISMDGPDILVNVCYEGLFVEKIYTANEKGEYKYDPHAKVVTIRVDTPDVPAQRVARVRFVGMVWNGAELEEDREAVTEGNLVPGDPVCTDEPPTTWDSLFRLKDARIEWFYEESEDAAWAVSFSRTVPGKGEKLSGKVHFRSYLGELDLPVELQLGEPRDPAVEALEAFARCVKMIKGCLPENKRDAFIFHLECLGTYATAADYNTFSRTIYDSAWKIWAEDQKEYLDWENGWSGYLLNPVLDYVNEDYLFQGSNLVLMIFLAPYLGPGLGAVALAFVIGETTELAFEFSKQYDTVCRKESSIVICALKFSGTRVESFITNLLTMGGDIAILEKKLPALKNTKGIIPVIAALFIWRYAIHVLSGRGWVESVKLVIRDLSIMSLLMLLGPFINEYGRLTPTDLKNKWNRLMEGKPPTGEKPSVGDPSGGIPKEKPGGKKAPGKEETTAPGKEERAPGDEPAGGTPREKPGDKEGPGKGAAKPGKKEPHFKPTQLGEEFREFTYEDAPDADVGKLTSGMTRKHIDAANKIAAEENADLLIRSTTPYAEELIRTGRADPKPEYVKTKTIDERDLHLNPDLKREDLGKVGYFEPKPPKRESFPKGPEGDAAFADVESRYKQRKQEFADQRDHIDEHSGPDAEPGMKLVVEKGVVKKVLPNGTRRDITGDYDVFGVIDRSTGKPVTDPVKMERIFNRLKQELNIQHPWQSQWDYRNESRTVPEGSPEGAQSPFDVKRGIDRKIIGSHTKGNEKAEPLIRFTGKEITGTWIKGVVQR